MTLVIPYYGIPGGEIRPLYFYKAMGKAIKDGRIISFGACNFSCPYCKRDGQFRDKDGGIISAIDVSMEKLFIVCDDAVKKKEIVRLSGGDPVMFPKESLTIATYMRNTYNQKISIAHNGSSLEFIRRMAPFLESAAIDLKALPSRMGEVAGISLEQGERMYKRSLQVQDFLSDAGVLVDIRTPVFGDTALDDMLQLAEDIVEGGKSENEFWTWRMYSPVRECDWLPPRKDNVLWMIHEVKSLYPDLKIGLRAKWDPNGFQYF